MAALLAPLLATMSAAARTAWPFIQRAVGEGMSANAIQDALGAAGVGVRRQDIQALVREARSAVLAASDIARLPRDILLPGERVREAITRIVAPFSYTVRLTGIDPVTGERIEWLRTAHSEELLPLGEVEASMLEAPSDLEGTPPLGTENAEVIDVIRSGIAGIL